MRFTQPVHWAEGLFLQPQHLQRLQQNAAQDSFALFSLHQPYPYGVIELELNEDALNEQRVVITKLKAVLRDGTLLDVPHNASIAPLQLSAEDSRNESNAGGDSVIEICLCVPLLSNQQSNISAPQSHTGRYVLSTEEVGDENTGSGGQEIAMVVRRYNAFLCERSLVPAQAIALPILHLQWDSNAQGQRTLQHDGHYMPPYLTVSTSCPLLSLSQDLLLTLRQQQKQLQHQLSERALESKVLTASEVIELQVLSALTGFVARAQCFLQPQLLSPFALYLELVELLSRLSILRPQVSLQIPLYDHDNALPCFEQVLRLIRLFLHEESAGECQIFDFVPQTHNTQILQLNESAPLESPEIYLALQVELSLAGASAAAGSNGVAGAGLSLLQVAQAIESGDNFRLLDPASYNERIRGVKLSYVRYPPQYLPQSNFNLLFRLKTDESVRVWHYIMSDKALLLDYAPELWGPVKAQLLVVTKSA